MTGLSRIALAALLAALAMSAAAQQTDPHAIYEQKCAACHAQHAGDFVFESTITTDNGLAGRQSGQLLSDYLAAGHGRLTESEATILIDLLENIKTSGRLFREKCTICHDNAVTLARRKLILRDDVLYGRYTGRDIADFLLSHGRLDPAQATRMVAVLKRQLLTQ